MDLNELQRFVVEAKQTTYVGDGQSGTPSRAKAHDLEWERDDWCYRDSYFGGRDFIGQEVVWLNGSPLWAMNYYGFILRDDLIDPQRAGETIKGALSALYVEGRFLGGWRWQGAHGIYVDTSTGDVAHFHGREVILCNGIEAYALDYHGGLIKD